VPLKSLLVRFRSEISITIVTAVIAIWAVSPSGDYTGPGTPLQFTRSDLSDTGVIGLTVDNGGTTLNADTVRRHWIRYSPTWLDSLMMRMEFGEGQTEARAQGLAAAAELNGDVPTPSPVHPGMVSGTSSGLAWALAALAGAHPKLTSAGRVAATGTLNTGGEVVVVGWLDVKLATPMLDDVGTIFVPYGQLDEVWLYHDSGNLPTAPIVGVRTVEEALGVLCLINAEQDGPCRRFNSKLKRNGIVVELGPDNHGICRSLSSVISSCRRVNTENGTLLQIMREPRGSL
jgi:hypothetical protein